MVILGNNMNFTEFKTHFQSKPYILSRDIIRSCKNPQILRNQISRWRKKGLIIALRRGMYVLNANDRKEQIDRNYVANALYGPSYLSLEYALNFYGFIPEKVADVTSVTTLKTVRFKNEFGRFIYQHIKPEAFRGFKRSGEGPNTFFIAEPEKAVLDFLYLNLGMFNANTRDVLANSYRFQNVEDLDKSRLLELGKLYHNKKLIRVIKDLCEWIDEERA